MVSWYLDIYNGNVFVVLGRGLLDEEIGDTCRTIVYIYRDHLSPSKSSTVT